MNIAVAMSGGLDSTMTAVLLKEAGANIVGVTADMGYSIPADKFNPFTEKSQDERDANIKAIKEVADKYQFPHYTVNIKQDFFADVIEPFCTEYINGNTPNPCILCNERVKFPSILNFADKLGIDYIATGHYANIISGDNGRYYISQGKDPVKDQSYFLYRLPQDILARTLFPLGKFLKSEVRDMARVRGLSAADSPESQEICFILDNNYIGFIEKAMDIKPACGDIVNTDGAILGYHKGIYRHTIGQRRGLGIAAERPLYVTGISAKDNIITVGFKEELFAAGLIASDIFYMKETQLHGLTVWVKTRSTQKPAQALLREVDDCIEVVFAEPILSVSPGQAAVFYNEAGDVLAGGTIRRALKSC